MHFIYSRCVYEQFFYKSVCGKCLKTILLVYTSLFIENMIKLYEESGKVNYRMKISSTENFNFLIFFSSIVKVDGDQRNCYCSVQSLPSRSVTSTDSDKKHNHSVHIFKILKRFFKYVVYIYIVSKIIMFHFLGLNIFFSNKFWPNRISADREN